MNALVQDMTWDVIQDDEGSEIQLMSDTETDEVNGAIHPAVAIGLGLAVGFAIARYTQRR